MIRRRSLSRSRTETVAKVDTIHLRLAAHVPDTLLNLRVLLEDFVTPGKISVFNREERREQQQGAQEPGALQLPRSAKLVARSGSLTISLVPQKTNAARLLDQLGIRYELREYEVDPDDLAAETVAAKIGLPPEQVFKTLVARGDRHGVVLAVIPGDQELDLKALAAAAEERKIQLVPVKELQFLTGYIRGGVTALGGKRDFPVFVDETIELFDVISISAGTRGIQILLSPADYLRATHAQLAVLGQPKKTP
jgi:Cys-tRNA(Pro)/Cys-tRNA(Cys) deacylase